MSRPARGKLLLVLSFVLTLGAGIVVGMGLNKQVVGQPPVALPVTPQPPAPSNPGSWFVTELNLSADQSEQMKSIWSQAMEGSGRELFDRRRSIYRERDKAIEALYTDEQRAERERLKKDFDARLSDNSKEREKLVQAAVEKTKAILNADQRQKYEQLLRDRAERDRHRGSSTRPGTQPSDRPPGQPPSFGPGFPGRRGGDDSRGPDHRGDPRPPERRDPDTAFDPSGRGAGKDHDKDRRP